MTDTDHAPPIRIVRGLAWSAVVIAAMLAASWYAWIQLPADAQLPSQVIGIWRVRSTIARRRPWRFCSHPPWRC